MVRVYKKTPGTRNYQNYSRESLQLAVAAYMRRNGSLMAMSERFGIPMTTIYRKSKGMNEKKVGGQTILSQTEERALCKALLVAADWGFLLQSGDIKDLVKSYLDIRGIKVPVFKDNNPGETWMMGFLKRNKDLSKRFIFVIFKWNIRFAPDYRGFISRKSLLACLAPLTNGLQLAWTSPFLPKITKDKDHYDISEEEASYLTIVQPISMILTCSFSSKLCDIIGRKKTLLLITLPHTLSWILAAVAQDIYTFYGSKLCSGIASGIAYAALPMYIGEVSSPEVRGTWGNLFSSAIYLGEFIMAILGSYFGVKETSYICIAVPILFSILFSFMPESPYFYIMKAKTDQAKTSLRFLKHKQNIEEDFITLQNGVKRQMSESAKWKDLVIIDSNKKAFIAAIFMRSSQVFGGLTVFVVYIQFIFEKSGGNVSPELSSMIYTGLTFVLNILVVIFVVDRFERKKAYIASVFPCAMILLLVSMYFFIDKSYPEIDVTSFKWVPITGMVLYQIFASFGIAVIPTLMLGELFSASIKSKAMTVMSIVFGVLLCITNYIFHALYFHLGLYAPFLFLGCCNGISTVLSWFLIPETKGKTLEEIQLSFKNNGTNNETKSFL